MARVYLFLLAWQWNGGSVVASRVESQGSLTLDASGRRQEAVSQRLHGHDPGDEDQKDEKEIRVIEPSGVMNDAAEDGLSGGWTPMDTWTPMWHPYLVLFWLHAIFAAVGTVMSLRTPRVLLVIMAATGLLWPISWAFGLRIWDEHHRPLTADWWMTFVKWVIVDALAGLPVLACRVFDFGKKGTVAIGISIYAILGFNILWTMLYKVDGYVRMWNTYVGVVLTLSLVVHCCATSWHGKPLLEVVNGFPYGRGTTIPWLVSYTTWNALFVADYSMGMTLQDILFWAMMYAYQCLDEQPMTIEYYFAFARPVQLGVYVALGCWLGIVPYLANATPPAKHTPLHVNEHSFFLFITTVNFCLAVYSLARAIQLFIQGPQTGLMQKRLTQAPISMRAESSD